MGKEIFFSAARSQAIEDNAIVSGLVDPNGKLILTKHNGNTVDAGSVKGPKGDDARYPIPNNASGVVNYVRIATLDGVNVSGGAHYNFLIDGLGDYGQTGRSTILVHFAQRGDGGVSAKAWVWDLRPNVKIYTRKLGPYLFEMWMQIPSYQQNGYLTQLAEWRAVRNLDSLTAVAPSGLSEIVIGDMDYVPKAKVSDTISDTSIITGVLEAKYRGGPARVKIDGVWSTEYYGWLNRYNPFGSREVRLIRTSSGWLISGQIEDKSIPLPYSSSWRSYSSLSGGWFGGAKAVKLASGIVVLKGMLLSETAPADNEVIVTLPEGFRPDAAIMAPVEHAETSRVVRIDPDGEVRVWGGGWSANWLSLDGIAFPSAGTATWTSIGSGGSTLGSSFQKDSGWTTQYGDPAYWKDPYGFVWWRGLLQIKTTLSADNTPIVTLPTAYRAPIQEHIRGAGNGGYSGFGSKVDTGLVWKPGSSPTTVGQWLSLGCVVTKTAEAYSLNPWPTRNIRFDNSWTQYPGSDITRLNYLMREDGLRILSGMMNGGTLGGNAFRFEEAEMLAEQGHITIPTMSNNSRSRITINPVWVDGDVNHGGVFINNGSNVWYSLDNRMWVP